LFAFFFIERSVMFDTVRNNSKLMMLLMFVLGIPSLALVGLDGYSRFNDTGKVVAQFDGSKITQPEWDEAHKREVERIRAQMPNVDPKLLDSDEARRATLDQLVNERLLALAAQRQLLITSDARLARDLQQNPVIAGLRGPDGKLDMERYRQLAASQGLTPEGLEARVRQDLSSRQVLAPLQASALALAKPTDAAVQAWLQRREVQVQKFAAKDYAAKVQASDTELEAHYNAHAERFRSAEAVDVEYLVLDLQSLTASITLPESDLKTYYEQNLQRLAGQEQRRASHILITAAKDAPAAERDKARARAQELLAQLRKTPKAFAELARKNSQDPGSAARGGDLDYFARGAMVKPFEDAVFGMKEGEISEVVESDFGFHLIELTAIKAPKAPSFEAMRPQLEADLRKQQAQRKFAELAETFSNSVYEQADALQPVADKLKLGLKQAKGVTRSSAGLPTELSNAKVLQALFSEDAVGKRRNTEAIEVGSNTLVSARVAKHYPSVVRPFAEVRDNVRQQFVQARALELARAEGQARLAAWKAQPDAATLGQALVVSRDQQQSQAQALVDAALRADPAQLPALLGVELGAEGYAVVRVNKIVPREAQPAEQARQTQQQFAQLRSQAEVQAYLAALKKEFKAEILVSARKSAEASEKP
jgi:peptidyl-prolyl cis-trans isomerase D